MQFSFTRIKNLIFRDSIVYRKPVLYSLFAVLAFSLFLFWIPTADGGFQEYDYGFWIGCYLSFLFIGGLLLASIIFWEFKSSAGRIQYLNLPATNMEKLLSRSFYTHILYPGFISIYFLIFYKLFRTLGMCEPLPEAFFEALPYLIGTYYSLISLMLVFAIIINNYVAPKAILFSGIIYVASLMIGAFIFRLIMKDLFYDMSLAVNNSMTLDIANLEPYSHTMLVILKLLLLVVVPLFLWTVAYFKMKEKQV